jgi:polyisoprenoid-binding protein YceI
MIELLLLAAAAADDPVLLSSAAADYRLQPAAGDLVQLTVEKTGLYKGRQHVFEFPRFRGELRYDPSRPESSSVAFDIEAAGAELKDRWLGEKDLKKVKEYALRDMLDAGRHPLLKFRSTRVERAGADRFRVDGTLEVRGIARPAQVEVTVRESGRRALALEGRSVVRLTSYGLKPPSAALGAIGTKDEMVVSFRLTAVERLP